MEIRGERECQACGTRWSYYETGSVVCPSCGSLRSVGVDDRSEHTDTPVDLDLAEARTAAGDRSTREGADLAADAAVDYLRERGFIDAGDLLDLDDEYVAAQELRAAATEYARSLAGGDDEERYVLALLAGADGGERPPPEEVPPGLRAARGLATARAVDAYLREFKTWRGDRDLPPETADLAERVREHARRLDALDGDVDPRDADRLLAATRSLADYARGGDPADLEGARAALDALAG